VPNVKGQKLAAARRVVTQAHCAVGRIARVRSSRKLVGRVVGESPAPKTVHPRGTRVNLRVGRAG